jgi:HEAT repeat protein
MRTADTIEESKAVKQSTSSDRAKNETVKKKYPVGKHPNTLASLRAHIKPWLPGVSGNPGGRPKYDVAAQIARAVLEQNSPEAYKALSKSLLKGNAYVFKELAERGFGKLREQHEIHHIYQEVKDEDLLARVTQLERDLGLAGAIDKAGRIGIAKARAGKKKVKA